MSSKGASGENLDEHEKQIEMWKIKKLIKMLTDARGNGTSMISLIMPPKDQVARVNKMLADEYGTASNIKNRVNRQSVLGAITSAQQRLKLYTKVPPNGLVVYTGMIVTEEGKEKKMNMDFEPFKPINTSLYLCDNKFHTEVFFRVVFLCTEQPPNYPNRRSALLRGARAHSSSSLTFQLFAPLRHAGAAGAP